MYKDITGIILSGGFSSRMGKDKAFLKLNDETVIEQIVKVLKSVFKEVIIITNTPDAYGFLSVRKYRDVHKYKGHIGGIHSGLFHSSTENNFIISCDLPLIPAELIAYIIEYKSEKPVKYCFADGRHHYLAGVYNKQLLLRIEDVLASGVNSSEGKDEHFSIRYFLNDFGCEVIYVDNLDFFRSEYFFNLNTPEDYEQLKFILNKT